MVSISSKKKQAERYSSVLNRFDSTPKDDNSGWFWRKLYENTCPKLHCKPSEVTFLKKNNDKFAMKDYNICMEVAWFWPQKDLKGIKVSRNGFGANV